MPAWPAGSKGALAYRRRCSMVKMLKDWEMQRLEDLKGEMTMKALLVLVAICISANAFAQDAPPKADNKPRAQVKPREPMGCKLVGTVRGTKLWAGDCEAAELRGSSAPATETPSLSERASGAIPPGQKQ